MADRSPLDDVEFLARSPHRLAVVRSLRERPRSRQDLLEGTGISQPTLGRVLGSLEDRDWIEPTGGRYALTPIGTLVTGAFVDLVDTVETIHRLDEVHDLQALYRLDLDIRLLDRATITAPKPSDPIGHIRRVQELLIGADRVRFLTPVVWPDAVERLLDRLDGDTSHYHETIFASEAIEAGLESPRIVRSARELLDAYDVELFRYEGSLDHMLAIADGTAVIGPLDDQRLPRAFIESDEESVLRWVEEELDAYRDASIPIMIDDLPT